MKNMFKFQQDKPRIKRQRMRDAPLRVSLYLVI